MPKGGKREGAGRKPRVKSAPATVITKLSMTEDEGAALELARPPALPLAIWLRSVIFESVFVACPKCQKLMLPDGRHVYGGPRCRPGK